MFLTVMKTWLDYRILLFIDLYVDRLLGPHDEPDTPPGRHRYLVGITTRAKGDHLTERR